MPTKTDETAQLLREIRDLQREQLAFQRAQSALAEHDRNMTRLTRALRAAATAVVALIVMGAYWYLYRTIGTMF